MKHKLILFAVVLFVLLAAWLEWMGRYHFFTIEQYQLFLLTGDYFYDLVSEPGGLAMWIAEGCVQFFAVPWIGSLLTALILTGVGVSTALVCRRLVSSARIWLPALLPVFGLLCVGFYYNHLYQGTIALLGTTTTLALWTRIPRFGVRLALAALAVPLLFWALGSVAVLFSVCVVTWEAANRTPKWWISPVVALEAVLVGWAAVEMAMLGDWQMALSPMLYYHGMVIPGPRFLFAWAGVPLAIAGARLCGRMKITSTAGKVFAATLQTLLAALIVWKVVVPGIDPIAGRMAKIDRLSALEDWDAVIADSRGGAADYISLAYFNLALAHKGALGETMFRYDQIDSKGLVYTWNMTLPSAIVLSDTYFAIGMINGAQEMAFEGMVSAPGRGSARMLKRLVQTNLIYGAWPVAEKYIDLLSKTLFYRDWAEAHRRFLGDDAAVEADPLLGSRRRCLPRVGRFFKTFYGDIELIARQNPDSRTAMEYLGGLALLSRDGRFFGSLVEAYYGTEYLPALPRAWQEAVVLFNRDRPEVWVRYGVGPHVLERFGKFAARMSENRDPETLANLVRREFGDTYWYYHTFKQ